MDSRLKAREPKWNDEDIPAGITVYSERGADGEIMIYIERRNRKSQPYFSTVLNRHTHQALYTGQHNSFKNAKAMCEAWLSGYAARKAA